MNMYVVDKQTLSNLKLFKEYPGVSNESSKTLSQNWLERDTDKDKRSNTVEYHISQIENGQMKQPLITDTATEITKIELSRNKGKARATDLQASIQENARGLGIIVDFSKSSPTNLPPSQDKKDERG
jgi:hypothetical protein